VKFVVQGEKMNNKTIVFNHHLYEYRKGLRNLILFTAQSEMEKYAVRKLEKHGISYLVYKVTESKVNIFFGDRACVDVLRGIGKRSLSSFSPEEDFILGIMLGYDRLQQCERYIGRIRPSLSSA
jgi:hypothetical protein